MKSKVICDFCGKEFERNRSQLKGKKHHFCCRKCVSDYSSKEKNPEHYKELKDLTSVSRNLSELNRRLNPTRMTAETREKIRNAHLNNGNGVTYTKLYGVHEHRLVAEKKIGRKLLPGEVVHHIDGNKRNNNPDNLIVFPSQSAHAQHHSNLMWFIKELEKIERGDEQ